MSKKIKEELPEFLQFSENMPNERMRKKIQDVCEEYPEYAADELLLLSEEILSQVSAYGVCLYLQKGGDLQTEKNNDYILHDLFLHDGHQNAGPIFYSVRGLVQELNTVLSDEQNELFSSESEINKKLQELATFRNALMHGFFKLPATENINKIKDFQKVIDQLSKDYQIFKHKADFHFWKTDGFCGHWNIEDNEDWDKLAGDVTSFEKLASRAKYELHPETVVNVGDINTTFSTNDENLLEIEKFISGSDYKESLYVQFHPRDKKQQDEFYESAYKLFKERSDLKIISYSIVSEGIGYTAYLLFNKICKAVGISMPKKEVKDKIVKAVKKEKKKLVILINNIHLVPFASDHITSLMKFFKESGIYFIGIGWEYEHLNSIFSQKLNLMEERKEKNERNVIPNDMELKQLIKNHTRHRGPYEKEVDYNDLMAIISNIIKQLNERKEIKARELADETINGQKPDIELINEALYILYPYFKYDQSGSDNNYLKDDLDELYGFPKNQTETSSIFLTLGRRDIELEYKHKILKP
jgi:hypothetical protein